MPTNTFKYQTIWTKEYQKSNFAMPIYPVISDFQFQAGLEIGDTVKRRYRSNPIFANDLGTDGSYSPQAYKEAEESFTISQQKEASVTIVKPTVLNTDLNITKSYGAQLSNALYQSIDGHLLDVARQGAGTTLDDGDFGGTAGNGLTVAITNIAQIPIFADERYQGTNVVINNTMRFGKIAYEDYGGMKVWIVPPQVWSVIQLYLMARSTPLGDKVTVNGYVGTFGTYQTFVNNNLPYTCRLAVGANPTDGDTMTIKGVTFRFKDTLAANGDIKIGATAADTVTNIAAALNALTTTTANFDAWESTDTVTENGYSIEKSKALSGISATDGTTYVDIVMKGTGKVTVSETFTSASNVFTPELQIVHSLFVIAKNLSAAIRQEPEIYDNPVGRAVARDYVMWTVFDGKVFLDQARAIIDLWCRCDATAFNTYSNVHA